MKAKRATKAKRPDPRKGRKNPNMRRSTSFAEGNNGNPNPQAGPGVPSRREDARYHLRRRLELGADEISPVTFCAADRLALRAVEQAELLSGMDSVDALGKLVVTAYGSKQETRDTTPPTPLEELTTQILATQSKIKLLKGGKK